LILPVVIAVNDAILQGDNPWYPYYVQKMIGTNLGPNDQILKTTVSDNYNFRTIAWNHDGKINVLVISKSKDDYTVRINGLSGTVTYQKIDESVAWTSPRIQSGQGQYFSVYGYAVALAQADSGAPPPPPPPPSSDIVVDDTEASFVGNWMGPTTATAGYYGSGYMYSVAGTGSNRATWSFYVPQAGSWEVFARWTSSSNRARNAPYTVNHAGGSTVVRVNQEVDGGEWCSLGVYSFNVGGTSVVLSNDADDVVIADAIRLVYIG